MITTSAKGESSITAPDFAISTRQIVRRGGARLFNAEPGEPVYLAAPAEAEAFEPEHIVAAAGRISSAERWARLVMEALPADPEPAPRAARAARLAGLPPPRAGDLVFYVHGYNVDPRDALEGHRAVRRGLQEQGFNAVVVSFDWPSQGGFLNYLEDSLDAHKAAPELVKSGIGLFASLTGPDCRTRVHVLAHSMGAMVARQACDYAGGHPATREQAWGLSQLVLVAADISARSLESGAAAAMLDRAQRVTNYASAHDAALATSNVKRFMSSPRLGRHGVPLEMRSRVVDVDCSARWQALRAGAPELSRLDAMMRSHSWYWGDTQVFMADLAATLRGDIDRNVLATRERDPAEPGRLKLRAQ